MPRNQNLHRSPITGRIVHLPQAAEPESKPKPESKQELIYISPPPQAYSPFAPVAPMPIDRASPDPNGWMINFHNKNNNNYTSPPGYQGNRYTYQPTTTTNNRYQYQPTTTTTNNRYQYQPMTTSNPVQYEPTTANNQYQPGTTPHSHTYQPSTVPPPSPNVSADTRQWPPSFSAASKTPILMSGALMDPINDDWKTNDPHRSHYPTSKIENGKEKKKAVHFTPSVSDREREKEHRHQRQQQNHHHHHQLANHNNDNNINRQWVHHPVTTQHQASKSKSKDGKTEHKDGRLMCEWCLEGAQEWFDEGAGVRGQGIRLCDDCHRVMVQARGRGDIR